MAKITIELIDKLENQIDNFTDDQLNKAFEGLQKEQPFLNSYIDATQEIFEDEEEFIDLANYFHLLTNMAFIKAYGEVNEIESDLIQEVDEAMIILMETLNEAKDFEEQIETIFSSHPEHELITYFYNSVFEEDNDYDDQFLELATQLILFTYGIVDIYTKSVNLN